MTMLDARFPGFPRMAPSTVLVLLLLLLQILILGSSPVLLVAGAGPLEKAHRARWASVLESPPRPVLFSATSGPKQEWFLDPATGSDANTGKSSASPKATWANLVEAVDGDVAVEVPFPPFMHVFFPFVFPCGCFFFLFDSFFKPLWLSRGRGETQHVVHLPSRTVPVTSRYYWTSTSKDIHFLGALDPTSGESVFVFLQ